MVEFADSQKKAVLQVNTGTESAPTVKNRPIGTGYIINPAETVTNEIIYQAAKNFAALQVHPMTGAWTEQNALAVSDE